MKKIDEIIKAFDEQYGDRINLVESVAQNHHIKPFEGIPIKDFLREALTTLLDEAIASLPEEQDVSDAVKAKLFGEYCARLGHNDCLSQAKANLLKLKKDV